MVLRELAFKRVPDIRLKQIARSIVGANAKVVHVGARRRKRRQEQRRARVQQQTRDFFTTNNGFTRWHQERR
eukprot:1620252-Lingulodinium_polyedra.AAC.1